MRSLYLLVSLLVQYEKSIFIGNFYRLFRRSLVCKYKYFYVQVYAKHCKWFVHKNWRHSSCIFAPIKRKWTMRKVSVYIPFLQSLNATTILDKKLKMFPSQKLSKNYKMKFFESFWSKYKTQKFFLHWSMSNVHVHLHHFSVNKRLLLFNDSSENSKSNAD